MDAFNRYHKCFFTYERAMLSLIGHDYFLPNFKPGILAFTMYAIAAVFISTNLYTILYYEPFIKLNGYIFMCMAMAVVVKIYSVKYSDRITWMINYLYDIYKVNATTKNQRRAAVFDRFAYYTEVVFKSGVVLYFASTIAYLFYPLCMYFLKGEIVTLIPTYFPGIDENTTNGYIILSCYHILLLFLSFVGISCSDLLFTMLIANTPIMSNMIELEVEQLNDILTSPKMDTLLMKSTFRNLLLMHREMTEFITTMDKTFFKICFAQISGAALASCVAFFVILNFDGFYFPVYMLLIALFFQIISFCALGTIIELANDQAYDSVINCKWYLLEPKYQRMFALLMQRCQAPRVLSVGGFKDLNMVTCVAVLKFICSFAMFIHTFLIQ